MGLVSVPIYPTNVASQVDDGLSDQVPVQQLESVAKDQRAMGT